MRNTERLTPLQEEEYKYIAAGKGQCSCHHAPCVHDVSAPIAVLLAEVEELRKERDAERERREQYQAAQILIAYEHAFPWMHEENRKRMEEKKLPVLFYTEDFTSISLLCSDTFGWACADGENISLAECKDLVQIMNTQGWKGLMLWIQAKRQANGEQAEFITPVKKEIEDPKMDPRVHAFRCAYLARAEPELPVESVVFQASLPDRVI